MADTQNTFVTAGGITVTRKTIETSISCGLDPIYEQIDQARGCVLASDYEYPGRYSRWDIGMIDPPVEMISQGRDFRMAALNERGKILLRLLLPAIAENDHVEDYQVTPDEISGRVKPMAKDFLEEDRSKQPSIFSVLRGLTKLLHCEDQYLSMFGAFGYDLVFQFEPVDFKHDRKQTGTDCHVFLADRISAINHQKEIAFDLCYEFAQGNENTEGISVYGERFPLPPAQGPKEVACDHAPGEYAAKVEKIREGCRVGDFFEVVLSQVFSVACNRKPSELFNRIRKQNPSPYGFLINLGKEQLIGGSPEMFVRTDGKNIETCPISGTVRRGESPMEDAKQILSLLNSKKDESELTMCTDVDRNDKSRVCVPGSVELIGRRLVETYSRLFHTVDHVKGVLRDDCDMFDAFLSHMWACTLTGSPKPIAMQTIENLENSARRWYGGCVGLFTFNDQLNTGITIRTVHLQDGTASVRAGATLLYDSTPDEEEQETRVKASAFLNAVTADAVKPAPTPTARVGKATKARILFVDNQDSFVHTLANYVRQTGVEVITLRAGFDHSRIDQIKPDLVFISPGPRTPEQMGVPPLVAAAVERNLPVFGVCLGHQGIAQYFGADLGVLDTPMHGKDSLVSHGGSGIFKDVPSPFMAGRYHSLFVKPDSVPDCMEVTAQTESGVIMGLAHKTLPIASVQFHPESILTLHDDIGLKIIANVVEQLIG
ncbi:MAG: anthranilate synthase component I [Sedimentisphaerales bacterium]|nr:anthranilate synthase component I [Sedimentisphaerales bacterium]